MSELEIRNVEGFEPATLYRNGSESITALDVAKKAAGDGVFLLAYTPNSCGFVTCHDGRLARLDGQPLVPESVFELRCFCRDFELRWVREAPNGMGKSIAVSERPIEGLNQEPVKDRPLEFFRRSDRYLLWGKGTERSGGVRLFEHRVGELPLPATIEEKLKIGGRVWLSFDEYFSLDECGNMVWRLERLKELEAE